MAFLKPRGALPSPPLTPEGRALAVRLLRERRGEVVGALVQALATSVLPLAALPLVRRVADHAIPHRDFRELALIAVGLIMLRATYGAAFVSARGAAARLKSAIGFDLRRDLVAALFRRAHVSHVRALNQPLAAHLVVDAERVEATVDTLVGAAFPAVVAGATLGLAMVWTAPVLVLALAPALPLVWVASRRAGGVIRGNLSVYHAAHDHLIHSVRFALDNFALTRLRGAEAAARRRHEGVFASMAEASVALAAGNARVAQWQSFTVTVAGIGVVLAGTVLIADGRLSVGALLAFLTAAGLGAGQFDRLAASLPVVLEGAASLDRVALHLASAPLDPYVGRRRLNWTGAVELEAVTFDYGHAPILRAVSLTLAPGEMVGLVGANGAGKTTLLNLVLGLYRPTSGRLTADGIAYDDLDVGDLRRAIGVSPQHPVFFSASAAENILFGVEGAGRADIEALVDRLGLGDMLAALPGGLDAPLGDGGQLLSGGQRQMIAILRALIGGPRLLILDEPTNHLDRDRAQGLIAGLRRAPGAPAMLVVTHDPGVVADLDRVLRLEKGCLTLERR